MVSKEGNNRYEKSPILRQTRLAEPEVKYSKGSYNKIKGDEQAIRISEGCPNGCGFCRETVECGTKPVYFKIPELQRNKVRVFDMNLIYKPKALKIIKDLGSRRVNGKVICFELVCGVDFRYMTQEIADALHENRFKNVRIAWDHEFSDQMKIKDCINMLVKAGYKAKSLSVFMVCNWEIDYDTNIKKLDLCKVWNVKVNDCWFDNQLSPNIKPIYWADWSIREFRRKCRKHNQLVLFGVDPEWKK